MTFSLFNLVCWYLFGLVWILGAIYNSYKAPKAKQKRFRYDWLILTGLVWIISHYAPFHGQTLLRFNIPLLQWIGTVLLLLSTLFTFWSRWVLGKMWATNAAVKTEHQLVTEGPYRITRHPIYTGILGMTIGSAFSLGEGLIFLGLIFVLLFFLNRIRIEEQLMTQTFGDQYLRYKKSTPQLIPGLNFRYSNGN